MNHDKVLTWLSVAMGILVVGYSLYLLYVVSR
ncbi:hypothetical protein ABIF97_000448 [Bradyrhizobium japonicum]